MLTSCAATAPSAKNRTLPLLSMCDSAVPAAKQACEERKAFCLSVLPQVADLKLKRAKWDTAEFHNFWVSLQSPATSLSVASG